MEEVLNGLAYCNLQELKQIHFRIAQEIAIREKREQLAKVLNSAKHYSGHSAVQRDREKSGFGM